MLTAEENGVTGKNADAMLKSDNPDIKRLLGVEGEMGKNLGLSKDFAYQIVKQSLLKVQILPFHPQHIFMLS